MPLKVRLGSCTMSNELSILPIPENDDEDFIKEFSEFRNIARENKYNIGGPSTEQVTKLISWGKNRNANFWIVKNSNQEIILRISARVSPHLENHGTIGLFEVNLQDPNYKEAFNLAINTVLVWLRKNHVKSVSAPVDMNTWFNYRFSLEGKHFWPRHSWEPTTPPEYLELFRLFEFKDHALFHSVFFPHFRIGNFCLGTGPMKKSYKNIKQKGFRLRPFDKERFKTHELPIFHEISHEAFQDSLLFEAIDLTTFSNLYAFALNNYDFSPSSVLIDPSGETAGFIFAFYDGDYLVIKSIAIRKKHQGKNLSSGMIYHAVKQSFSKKKKGTISALVKLGLASESIEKNVKKTLWLSWSHHYVLLQKEI